MLDGQILNDADINRDQVSSDFVPSASHGARGTLLPPAMSQKSWKAKTVGSINRWRNLWAVENGGFTVEHGVLLWKMVVLPWKMMIGALEYVFILPFSWE